MGNKIVIKFDLEEIIKQDIPGYESIEKNIGIDKNILVGDIFNYMTNPEATPELENKAYTESQKEMIDVVKSLYSHISNLNEKAFHYRAVDNEIKFMYFDKKLSAYPDAFHTGNSSQEFGEFSENSPEEKVYLEAFQHDNGGNK